MTRNLPEPDPDGGSRTASGASCRKAPSGGSGQARPEVNWRALAHEALDRLLDDADLHRATGRVQIMIDVNEGGPRAVRTGTDLILRPKG